MLASAPSMKVESEPGRLGNPPRFNQVAKCSRSPLAVRSSLWLRAPEMARRLAKWSMPPYKATRGTLYKFIKNVKDASQGCVTDE